MPMTLITAAAAGIVVAPGLGSDLGLGVATSAPDVPVSEHAPLTSNDVSIVQFDAGSSILSDLATSIVQQSWQEVSRDSAATQVLVIAYADDDYPRDPAVNLSSEARQLAEDRAQAVRECLLDRGALEVTAISMAKRANWLQTLFITADAQLKRLVDGLPLDPASSDPYYEGVAKVLASDGGPGKVFIVMRKDLLYAH